ncbi:MAG: carboxypeptidase-like regulatory domain-containing protein, partial [Anaerolineae bacterium]
MESGVIWGQARDILTGQPVAGAFVYLEGVRGGVYTDAGGYYRLAAPPGQWTVAIRADGYLDMSQTYVRVLVGRTTRVDFALV